MRTLLPLTLALLAGCPDRTISAVTPEQGRVEYKDIPITVNRKIDILFVIDDSGSMADKQNNLATNFPNFINVLETIPGGLPDVHIGVVSSDVGAKATQDAVPASGIGGCINDGDGGDLQTSGAALSGGTFLSDVRDSTGARVKNYSGNLADVFSQMAKLGKNGCGFEQHLESMRKALSNNPANSGFLRPEAYLAVIFIADEDDCSMSRTALLGPKSAALGTQQSFRCTRFGVTCDQGGATTGAMNQVGSKDQCHPNEGSEYLEKVQTYVDFLKGLKPGHEDMVIVAGIMGTIEPFQVELRTINATDGLEPALAHSCSYTGASGLEVADPPIRLKFLLDQFPNRSTFTSICQNNLSDGLRQIAELLRSVLPDPCIRGTLADVDPNTAGPQYDCSVSDVQNPYKANRVETIIPACDATMSAKPCWHIVEDTIGCTEAPNLAIKIERTLIPPDDTHIIASCVTEAI